MFDLDLADADLSGLDADALLSAAEDDERLARRAEARRLAIAAAWADLHGALDRPRGSVALPGAEQLVQLGGDGTPEVAEFASAELGCAQATSAEAATALIADALDLRHRLPLLWARDEGPPRGGKAVDRLSDRQRQSTGKPSCGAHR